METDAAAGFDPDDLFQNTTAPASDERDPGAFEDDDLPDDVVAEMEEETNGHADTESSKIETENQRTAKSQAPRQDPPAKVTPKAGPPPVAEPSPKKARLKTLFEQVIEGQPPERAQRFLELKNVMGLRDDDALWGVIAVMDIHLKLFEQIPNSISEASIAATEAAKAQAIAEIQAALGRESEKMSKAVAEGIEAKSATLFMEHLTWYGTIVLLFSSFVFTVGYAAGAKAVPPWMTNGLFQGLMNAPLGPVAGSALIASSIFLLLRGITSEQEGKFGKAYKYAKIISSIGVSVLGFLML